MKGFYKFNEALGANSMEIDTADLILSPDERHPSSLAFHQGTAGAIPTHWNNSPFLSGGRLTSAFGANPKKKGGGFRIKKYKDYLKSRNTVSESSYALTFIEFIK